MAKTALEKETQKETHAYQVLTHIHCFRASGVHSVKLIKYMLIIA